ncbi:hypothetical protein L6164_016211 [Bauhinia variegata]|uniref:Uncharacterized protein n=1 Tax=Bauhinia variegata TaxID=167791 RepID=A0ACB9NMY8_BAUVA|nr:hypothetical protein L6164_016211 [Bauhinia variegata]
MGNIIESFISGFANVFGKKFGSPIDFLSGKSCSSVCGPTWDFICYIENFCIANLLRLAMVFILLYIVLLFFYVSYKLGIFECLGRAICRMIWGCFSCCFHGWKYCCTFLCVKLQRLRRTRRRYRKHRRRQKLYSTSEEDYSDDQSLSYYGPISAETRRSFSRRKRDYIDSHLKKSLRPRSHHSQLGIRGNHNFGHRRNPISENPSYRENGIKHCSHANTVHGIKVTRTSKFVNKGTRNRRRVQTRQN